MPPDQNPIPRDELPPAWGLADHCDEYVEYRRNRPSIELIAAQTDADHSHPVLGLERCWELRYRYPIGEVPVSDSVGRVSTRHAALSGLLECMHRIHNRVEDLHDPLEIQAVLDGVSLGNVVPDGTSKAPYRH
ncbi:hypothetical protein [Halomontanus rarus]|uniref:hypothetical protein n=1 Tax=Halomontanus rarus TaxID=3034020 RepID=UPI001A9831B5